MPEVSVIMGVRNGGRFLATAVANMRAQTFTDWKVIIVDNGSPGGALAAACREATGRYLAVLAMDDLALPRRLEIQRTYLDLMPEVCLLAAGSDVIDRSGQFLGREPLIGRHEDIFALTAYVHGLRHSSVMFRRDFLEHVRYRLMGMGAVSTFLPGLPRSAGWKRCRCRFASIACTRTAIRAWRLGALSATGSSPCSRTDADVGYRRTLRNGSVCSAPSCLKRRATPAGPMWPRTDLRSGGHGRPCRPFTPGRPCGRGLAGVGWPALRAVVSGLLRVRPVATAIAQAWLKDSAHQLLRACGASDSPQF